MAKINNHAQLDKLTLAIEKLLLKEVAPVAPVLPVLPVAPVAPVAPVHSGDHDLLIQVVVKVDALIIAVEKMSTADNAYVMKEDFVFWRNLLVSGMMLTVFLAVVVGALNMFFQMR